MFKVIEWESFVVMFVFGRGIAGKSLSVCSLTYLSVPETTVETYLDNQCMIGIERDCKIDR